MIIFEIIFENDSLEMIIFEKQFNQANLLKAVSYFIINGTQGRHLSDYEDDGIASE